jgi:hypothetical protein
MASAWVGLMQLHLVLRREVLADMFPEGKKGC